VESIRIPRRFCGPDDVGNGGYSCGLFAHFVTGAAEVSLHAPPPLERELAVERTDGEVVVTDGDVRVASARPGSVAVEPPPAVSVEEAAAASRAFEERWFGRHPFPRCVVCGPDRSFPDGFRVFPGPVGDDGAFAATWTPEGEPGSDVAPELVWAALDCPTSAPVASFLEGPAMVLASLTARLGCPLRVGEPHTILSWALDEDGRKHWSAAALFDANGLLLCASRALWIELKQE